MQDISPSDYSNSNNWYMCPQPTEADCDVDVIFLLPSSCFTPESGQVCAIDDASLRAAGPANYAQRASAFEGVANIYFPWWRQVNAALLPTMTFDEVDALEQGAPRADVFAALDYYFEHFNGGRPFMLAGHSQGSRLIGIVLSQYMPAHPDLYANMICAYMLGDGLTKDYLAANPHVKVATCADDLGVVVSWNTEGPANICAPSLVVPPNCVCINPLNWKTDETYAPASQNLGCMLPNPADGTAVPAAGIADAQIDLKRGSVIVSEPACEPYSMHALVGAAFDGVFGPQSYHACDYGFFYNNIRQNARDRIAAWQDVHAS